MGWLQTRMMALVGDRWWMFSFCLSKPRQAQQHEQENNVPAEEKTNANSKHPIDSNELNSTSLLDGQDISLDEQDTFNIHSPAYRWTSNGSLVSSQHATEDLSANQFTDSSSVYSLSSDVRLDVTARDITAINCVSCNSQTSSQTVNNNLTAAASYNDQATGALQLGVQHLLPQVYTSKLSTQDTVMSSTYRSELSTQDVMMSSDCVSASPNAETSDLVPSCMSTVDTDSVSTLTDVDLSVNALSSHVNITECHIVNNNCVDTIIDGAHVDSSIDYVNSVDIVDIGQRLVNQTHVTNYSRPVLSAECNGDENYEERLAPSVDCSESEDEVLPPGECSDNNDDVLPPGECNGNYSDVLPPGESSSESEEQFAVPYTGDLSDIEMNIQRIDNQHCAIRTDDAVDNRHCAIGTDDAVDNQHCAVGTYGTEDTLQCQLIVDTTDVACNRNSTVTPDDTVDNRHSVTVTSDMLNNRLQVSETHNHPQFLYNFDGTDDNLSSITMADSTVDNQHCVIATDDTMDDDTMDNQHCVITTDDTMDDDTMDNQHCVITTDDTMDDDTMDNQHCVITTDDTMDDDTMDNQHCVITTDDTMDDDTMDNQHCVITTDDMVDYECCVITVNDTMDNQHCVNCQLEVEHSLSSSDNIDNCSNNNSIDNSLLGDCVESCNDIIQELSHFRTKEWTHDEIDREAVTQTDIQTGTNEMLCEMSQHATDGVDNKNVAQTTATATTSVQQADCGTDNRRLFELKLNEPLNGELSSDNESELISPACSDVDTEQHRHIAEHRYVTEHRYLAEHDQQVNDVTTSTQSWTVYNDAEVSNEVTASQHNLEVSCDVDTVHYSQKVSNEVNCEVDKSYGVDDSITTVVQNVDSTVEMPRLCQTVDTEVNIEVDDIRHINVIKDSSLQAANSLTAATDCVDGIKSHDTDHVTNQVTDHVTSDYNIVSQDNELTALHVELCKRLEQEVGHHGDSDKTGCHGDGNEMIPTGCRSDAIVPAGSPSTETVSHSFDDFSDEMFDSEWLDDGFETMTVTHDINKSPPPYSADVTSTVPVLPACVVPTCIDELLPVVYSAVDVFWQCRRYGESWETVLPPPTYFAPDELSDSTESTARRVYKQLIFDLVAEILQDIYREDEPVLPSVDHSEPWAVKQTVVRPRQYHVTHEAPPTTITDLRPVIKQHVLVCLGLTLPLAPPTGSRRWLVQRKRKDDVVDRMLVEDLLLEEPDWTNYSVDITTRKHQITDIIADALIIDTLQTVNMVRRRRQLHLTTL